MIGTFSPSEEKPLASSTSTVSLTNETPYGAKNLLSLCTFSGCLSCRAALRLWWPSFSPDEPSALDFFLFLLFLLFLFYSFYFFLFLLFIVIILFIIFLFFEDYFCYYWLFCFYLILFWPLSRSFGVYSSVGWLSRLVDVVCR